MEIKLIPSPAKEIAENILKGVLPPETYDLEVVAWLSMLDPELTVYRIDEFNKNGDGDRHLDTPIKVSFSTNQIKIALERDIEIRPIKKEVEV